MASRTIVILTDDLDGGQADETLSFGLDGRVYAIDLSEKNAAKLRDALARYVAAGRRAERSASQTSGSEWSAERTAMRAWARMNGYAIGERGRISAEIREAYAAR